MSREDRLATAILCLVGFLGTSGCQRKTTLTAGPHSPQSPKTDTAKIKAAAVVILSNGEALRMGGTQLVEKRNGEFAQSPTLDTVWIFRDFNGMQPDQVKARYGDVKTGKAYIITSGGVKAIGDVDLNLTDNQIAAGFGIQTASDLDRFEDIFLDGNLAKVKSLGDANPDLVSGRGLEGNTALCLAVWHGHKDVAEFLLAKGADVNARNNRGETPLHAAEDDSLGYSRKAVAKLLRQHGGQE